LLNDFQKFDYIIEFFIVLVFDLQRSIIVSETALHTTSLLEETKNTGRNQTSFTSAAICGVCGITQRIRYGHCDTARRTTTHITDRRDSQQRGWSSADARVMQRRSKQ